ncbi:MAG: hypothetical protein GIW94_12330 [Candidatus Eremiobacteraeota bacterium]|nr:hypothetical protein [Candidatus Eremiobacteraeota bacterium]
MLALMHDHHGHVSVEVPVDREKHAHRFPERKAEILPTGATGGRESQSVMTGRQIVPDDFVGGDEVRALSHQRRRTQDETACDEECGVNA